MAIVERNSTALTNQYATPPVLNEQYLVRAEMLSAVGAVTTVVGDSIGSTYWFCEMPSSARIILPIVRWDGGTPATTAFNLGIYNSNTLQPGTAPPTPGSVVNATLFGSAITPGTGPQYNILWDWIAVDDQLRLWQLLGLSSDPGVNYAIVATLTAASASAQGISFQMIYTNNI